MRNASLVVMLVCSLYAIAHSQSSVFDQPLDVTLSPLTPLADRETMLVAKIVTKAARLPLGFEQAAPLPRGTGKRTPQSLAGMSLRQVLDRLVRLDPRYSWRDVDGVAVVRPVAAWDAMDSVLNRRVQNVHWTGVDARQILDRLTRLLYGTTKNGPPQNDTPGAGAPTFTVDLATGTAMDILCLASKAGGLIWWTQNNQAASGASTVMVSLTSLDGAGPVVTWPLPQ